MVNFTGQVKSDFLKLVGIDNTKKSNLIDYSVDDYISFRDALINYAKAVYPLDYQNFVESDFGMYLLELVAYIAAVNANKADMLANENYLRTARKRENVKKLLELIGVRMKGPISAAANAKLTYSSTPAWGTSYGGSNKELVVSSVNRTVTVASPEDGGQVSFTLYKVLPSGDVDIANSTGDLTLYKNEADNDAGTVFINLVFLEGGLVRQEGVFTSTDAVKTISLDQYPVVEKSVQVFVAGGVTTNGAYKEVDNIFFASGSGDKTFQIVTDDDFKAAVVFGDNNLGVSPLPGDSYVITYRIGGGSRGNIASEYINASQISYLDGVRVNGIIENTSVATGGANQETVEHAKKYAPLTFRRQDRLVTLKDFQTFINSFFSSYGSTGKGVAAVRRAYSSGNIIDLYVLEKASDIQLRKATPAYKQALLEAIEEKKMLTDKIVIVDGLVRTLDLILTIRIDKELKSKEEEIKLKVKDKVLEFFNVDNNDFGKSFIPEDLSREIFELEDVRFTTVDNVRSSIIIDFNEIIQLNNLSINVSYV